MENAAEIKAPNILAILQELVESVQMLDRAMREATQQLRLRDDAQQKALLVLEQQVSGLAPSIRAVLVILKPVAIQQTVDEERVNVLIEYLEKRLSDVGKTYSDMGKALSRRDS